MMPTPVFVLALQAARQSRPEDKPALKSPQDRRPSIRLVWSAGDKPVHLTGALTHTKER